MFYKKIFYYFKEALSEKLCDDIIQIAMDDKPDVAVTGLKIRNDEDAKNLLQKRDSYITWLNEEWIYKEIRPYVHRANKLAGWNFDIVDSEPCQLQYIMKVSIMVGIQIHQVGIMKKKNRMV